MISVTCTACKTHLEVDDAFAGGVCRCSSCGAIQTVPNAAQPGAPASGKTLFRKKGQAVVGSGLDELAQVVASSGLGASRLKRGTSPTLPSDAAVASAKSSRKLWMLIASIAVGMVAGGIFFFAFPTPAPTPSPNAAAQPDQPGGPVMLASLDLTRHNSVVFLIDRGASSSEVLSPLKQIVTRTLYRMGKDRRFAVAFWNNGTPDVSYPDKAMSHAVPESVSSASRAMDDVIAFGQSAVTSQIATALAEKPDAIVLITAKGFDLDDTWALSIESALKGHPPVAIHTLSIGSVGPSTGLKRLAEKSGGTYLELTAEDVRQLAGQ